MEKRESGKGEGGRKKIKVDIPAIEDFFTDDILMEIMLHQPATTLKEWCQVSKRINALCTVKMWTAVIWGDLGFDPTEGEKLKDLTTEPSFSDYIASFKAILEHGKNILEIGGHGIQINLSPSINSEARITLYTRKDQDNFDFQTIRFPDVKTETVEHWIVNGVAIRVFAQEFEWDEKAILAAIETQTTSIFELGPPTLDKNIIRGGKHAARITFTVGHFFGGFTLHVERITYSNIEFLLEDLVNFDDRRSLYRSPKLQRLVPEKSDHIQIDAGRTEWDTADVLPLGKSLTSKHIQLHTLSFLYNASPEIQKRWCEHNLPQDQFIEWLETKKDDSNLCPMCDKMGGMNLY